MFDQLNRNYKPEHPEPAGLTRKQVFISKQTVWMQTNFSTVQQKLYRLLWLAPDILLRLPYARITSLLVNRVIAQLESLNGGEQS